ncbi:SCP domain-containing protein [Meloidogyne graminicola]|uniref:SCP domain-containing protein n=1 Tax=Meloidogyne graminicola TaxID=189291 RepID=A0A8T0A416_9BILA|nr:SCP domain-containing protein [Meloidogyne graminicola]
MVFSLILFLSTVFLYLSNCFSLQLHQARMTNDLRLTILRAHNNYRSQLANGKVTDGSKKTLPPGKNIYKFVYNVTIEKLVAQKTADMCKMEHPGTVGYGENLYANSWAMDNLTDAMIGAATGWWAEKDVCPIIRDKLQVTADVFDKCGHWVPMAWSHTTQIGCGVQLCPPQDWCSGWNPPCFNTTLVSCNYYNPTNDAGNTLIYQQASSACRSDADCGYYKNSKCETKSGLCIPPKYAKDPHTSN